MKKLFRGRHMATPLLLLFACLLALLCLSMDALELAKGLRTDVSFNALTTTSATTKDILSEVQKPVHIYAIYPKGEEDLHLNEVLKRYQALNPLVTFEVTDLTMNPALATRFKGDGDNPLTVYCLVAYCQDTGRYKIIKYENMISYNYSTAYETVVASGLSYEKALTEAILYVTRDEIPTIAVLQGHGELDKDMTGYFTSLLSSNHYDVSFIDLKQGGNLDKTDVLCLLSPVKDLDENELSAIIAYADRGGSLFITCDSENPVEKMPNFLSLLRLYGFIPMDGAVIAAKEEPSTYFRDLPYMLFPVMESTAVTSGLLASKEDTLLLQLARAFEAPGQQDNSLRVETVLSSSENAYLCDLNRGDIEKREGDPTGPFALALLSQRMMETTALSNAYIMSSSVMLTNGELYQITDSGTFILHVLKHLAGQDNISLAIEQKVAVRPGLTAKSQTLGLIIIIAGPMLVLAAALFILAPRRNR